MKQGLKSMVRDIRLLGSDDDRVNLEIVIHTSPKKIVHLHERVVKKYKDANRG